MKKIPHNEEFPLIHEIQVTNENVPSLLYGELTRLLMKYGRQSKDCLFALALGPNAYKAFEVWGKVQFLQKLGVQDECPTFHGVRVVCGPLPFIVPLFTERGWHFAQSEAVRIMDAMGGLDS